jgi:hypothetical protein
MVVVLSVCSRASTYYVSSSAGNDSNSGTATSAAWKTLAKVNGSTFVAGDRILLARGHAGRKGSGRTRARCPFFEYPGRWNRASRLPRSSSPVFSSREP